MNTQVWSQQGNALYLQAPSHEHEKLENAIYTIGVDMFGRFFLTPIAKDYKFDYKIYNLETKFINRVVKTYTKQTGNMGVLLNGVKGTGKTVTAKQICNKMHQPVIVVNQNYENVQMFINSIPQDIVIFIDEYEKIFKQSNNMLTIMDGALNSIHRRVFLLTTNRLNIEDNLKQRPGRLRYSKTFDDLNPDVVNEIIDDLLEYDKFRDDCVNFFSTLQLVTVDIVKAIIEEVNMHEEAPQDFSDVFNVKKIEGFYKIYDLTDGLEEPEMVMDTATISPAPKFNIHLEGNVFHINNNGIGRIMKVLGPNTLVVGLWEDDDRSSFREELTLRFDKTYGTHMSWAWSDGENANRIKASEAFAQKIQTPASQSKKDNSPSLLKSGKVAYANKGVLYSQPQVVQYQGGSESFESEIYGNESYDEQEPMSEEGF